MNKRGHLDKKLSSKIKPALGQGKIHSVTQTRGKHTSPNSECWCSILQKSSLCILIKSFFNVRALLNSLLLSKEKAKFIPFFLAAQVGSFRTPELTSMTPKEDFNFVKTFETLYKSCTAGIGRMVRYR